MEYITTFLKLPTQQALEGSCLHLFIALSLSIATNILSIDQVPILQSNKYMSILYKNYVLLKYKCHQVPILQSNKHTSTLYKKLCVATI